MSSSHSAIQMINQNDTLTIVGVQEHGVEGELGSDSFADIEEVEHLLNRLVSLLSHTSIGKKELSFSSYGANLNLTCGRGGCHR